MLDPLDQNYVAAPKRYSSFSEIRSKLTPREPLGGFACLDFTASTEVRGSIYKVSAATLPIPTVSAETNRGGLSSFFRKIRH